MSAATRVGEVNPGANLAAVFDRNAGVAGAQLLERRTIASLNCAGHALKKMALKMRCRYRLQRECLLSPRNPQP
jgi:hypothetical protein